MTNCLPDFGIHQLSSKLGDDLRNKPADQLWKTADLDAATSMPCCLQSLHLGFISLHDDSGCYDTEDDGYEQDDPNHEHKHEESELSRLLKFLDQHCRDLESLSLAPAHSSDENGLNTTQVVESSNF